MSPRRLIVFLTGLAQLAPATARADDRDGSSDSASGRHLVEVGVGGGMLWISDDPDGVDVQVAGQLSARVAIDLIHVRAEAWAVMPDPTRPDRFQLRADGRLLFVTVHDFTWRRTDAGETLRLLAGLGGEVDLPDDTGHLMLNLGFAMTRRAGVDGTAVPVSEGYGAYAGVTARLHLWEIRDELRVAVHAMTHPPTLEVSADGLNMDALLGGITVGATVSNRLYVQALREGVVSLGPELNAQLDLLLEGPAFQWTLGVAGTLGL